jgi:hypothetical protein
MKNRLLSGAIPPYVMVLSTPLGRMRPAARGVKIGGHGKGDFMSEQFDAINTVEDVQALIDNSVHESEVLEYKTASAPFDDKGRKEVAKDVSAMANSLGGVIIYGVATDPTLKSKPVRMEDVDPKCFAALDQVVNSQVRPPVAFRKKLIPPSAPRVMVVDVPASEDPPHQSLYDKRYYRRSGEESIAMEHDLVAMYFGRRRGPVLEILFQRHHQLEPFQGEPPVSNTVLLRVLVNNVGKRSAHHVLAVLGFPDKPQVEIVQTNGSFMRMGDVFPNKQVLQYSEALAIVHATSARIIGDVLLKVSREYAQLSAESPFVEWELHADEMEAKSGVMSLRQLGWA